MEKAQNFENVIFLKIATINQLVLSLIGILVEFFCAFVCSDANFVVTRKSIRTDLTTKCMRC